MKIIKMKSKKFGTPELHRIVSGYAFYEAGKGFLAFSSQRDEYGILTPYNPRGGKKALEAILSAGGFTSLDGMEYVNPIN